MTISPDHPFLPSEPDRDPVRRLRGRLISPVTLWTAADDGERAGLTVGSSVIADGAPSRVLGLIDPEADLLDVLTRTERFAVIILDWSDRNLADVFAGLAPAPGGSFGSGSWSPTEWGPVPDDRSWCGCGLVEMREAGYATLVIGMIESVRLADESMIMNGVLGRLRGRYVAVQPPGSVTPGRSRESRGAQ